MTLADLAPSLPLSCEEGRGYGLVFNTDLAMRLAEVQAANPSQHVAQPVALVDGRWLLCGDLLSEVGPGGLYAGGFSHLDPARFDEIEVLPWGEAVALLPAPPPMP
jgi:hypothetical protein